MNIHEYQAKGLLRSYGVPVSDGRVVLRAEEAKTAAGEMDGTSLFLIESGFGPSNDGVFAEAKPCGASAPSRAVEMDLAFALSEPSAAVHCQPRSRPVRRPCQAA